MTWTGELRGERATLGHRRWRCCGTAWMSQQEEGPACRLVWSGGAQHELSGCLCTLRQWREAERPQRTKGWKAGRV